MRAERSWRPTCVASACSARSMRPYPAAARLSFELQTSTSDLKLRTSIPLHLDEQLRRRARPDRDWLAILAAQPHAVRRGVPSLDLNRLSGLESMALDEPQEGFVLVH